MIASFPVPARRCLALTILMVLLLVVWEIIVEPIAAIWQNAGGDSGNSLRLLAAYQKSIRDEPLWSSSLQQMQRGDYANVFVDAANTDIASAKLQQDIKRITEINGGTLRSIQILPVVKQQDLQRVNVRISFSIPIERMVDTFAKFDEARPYIFVDDLLVTAPEGEQNTGAKPVQLQITCELSAYMRPVVQ